MILAVFMSRYNFLVPFSSFGLRKLKYRFTVGTKPAQQLPFHHWDFHDLLGNSRTAWGGSNWFHGDITSLQTPLLPALLSQLLGPLALLQVPSSGPGGLLEMTESGEHGYDLPPGQGGGSAGAGWRQAAGERSQNHRNHRITEMLSGGGLPW